jgi:cell division protein FtsA
LGVVLVDIGGGTTDIAIFSQGAIRHTAVIPIAGDQITNDIAMALRTPTIDAEDLKIHFGIARQSMANPNETIEVPGVGDREARSMSRQALAAVIEPRVEELLSLVRQVVRESGMEDLVSSGVVLTGGTSLMPGVVELAEEVFAKPARVGFPEYKGHLSEILRSPRYSTGLGLLMEGRVQLVRGRRIAQSGTVQNIVARMREWFMGNF